MKLHDVMRTLGLALAKRKENVPLPTKPQAEKEKAAFYQEHKDDPDVWGDDEAEDYTDIHGYTVHQRIARDIMRQGRNDRA